MSCSCPPSPAREEAAVLERDETGKPTVWCDPCIADLVAALNTAQLRTVASCCGHNQLPGRISLADGRDLLVVTPETAEQITAAYKRDIHGETTP